MTVENAYKIKEFYKEPEEKIVSPQSFSLPAGTILLAVCIAFGVYVSDYYHADPAAEDALAAWMNLQ